MKIFSASLSTGTKIITAIMSFVLLFAAISSVTLFVYEDAYLSLFIGLLLLAVFIFLLAVRPLGYIITDDFFAVRRLAGMKKFYIADVQEIVPVNASTLKSSVRVFGVGGVFGYFGKFYHPKLGIMMWYATKLNHPLLVIMKNETKIIVTPDEQDLFLSSIQQKFH